MKWYLKYLSVYNHPYDQYASRTITKQIKDKIEKLQSKSPLVTVSVIAHNEEKHLLSCLWSLSDMKCRFPVEIIGIDNDSEDNTLQIFKDCNIPTFIEKRHSCGFARQCGLNHAKGKYHINIDSDTMYPPQYIEIMTDSLSKTDIVGVCSLWSYIPDNSHSKIALLFYELFRDIYLYIQSFKRPELSVRGLVFGYNTNIAKKIGIRTNIIRGEDGSLALELKKYGRILFIKNNQARAITGYGTIDKDGTLFIGLCKRAFKIICNLKRLFTTQENYNDKKNNII